MALTSTSAGGLHPGSGARGFSFGLSSASNQDLYTCPAGKIAYIYAGAYLKIDGLSYPGRATGGGQVYKWTEPFYITAGQTISSGSTSESMGFGIEIDA